MRSSLPFHKSQTMFMPSKGTDINLRRLHAVMVSADFLTPSDAVASLDAEKAFDSVGGPAPIWFLS